MQVYHIPGPAPLYTNSFLLIGSEGHAVAIDPNADAQRYLDVLEENGASLTQILLTHGHFDHVGAVAALRLATGARVHLNAADAAGAQDRRLFPFTDPDCAFADGEVLDVDDMRFHVIATPGHSAGSVSLLCGELLFCGDTLFCGDAGRTDLEGGSETQLLESLAKLAAQVPDAAQVLPGHGEFSVMEQEKRTNPMLRKALGERA